MTRYAWSRKKEVLELSDFNANRKMRCTADFAHDDPLASWSTKTSCFLHVKNWVEKHICFRGHMGTEKSKGFQHKIFGKLEKKSPFSLIWIWTTIAHTVAKHKFLFKNWYFIKYFYLNFGAENVEVIEF